MKDALRGIQLPDHQRGGIGTVEAAVEKPKPRRRSSSRKK